MYKTQMAILCAPTGVGFLYEAGLRIVSRYTNRAHLYRVGHSEYFGVRHPSARIRAFGVGQLAIRSKVFGVGKPAIWSRALGVGQPAIRRRAFEIGPTDSIQV